MNSESNQQSGSTVSTGKPTTRTPVQQDENRAEVEIRTVRHADGTQSSVRMDQPEIRSGQKPHIRTEQLNHYVEWLKNLGSDKFYRIDDPSPSSATSPRISASNFKNQADLERIEAKLAASASQTETENKTEVEQSVSEPASRIVPPEIEDSEELIQTIANAIASVLNEEEATSQPEPDEQAGVTDVSRMALDTSVSGNDYSALPAASAMPLTDDANAMPPTNDQTIPTDIAAWDVEDFRWPETTKLLLTQGGQSIQQLTQAVLTTAKTSGTRVAVMGVGRAEGTTSIALGVARCAADQGKKVLLVDADLANPSLSHQVGLSPNISWLNAINGSLGHAEVIIRSEKNQLCIMPIAPIINRSALADFIHDQLGELIAPIQSRFDLILIDSGPAIQLISELSRPAQLVDAGLIVHSNATSPAFSQTREQLLRFGLNKQIVAQNSSRLPTTNVA